jgi:hypothetical protein
MQAALPGVRDGSGSAGRQGQLVYHEDTKGTKGTKESLADSYVYPVHQQG